MYPCSSDKECSVGSYCHSPHHSPSRCLNCRRRKKRCNRDSMCCPGNRCSNCTWLTLETRQRATNLQTSLLLWLNGTNTRAAFSLSSCCADICVPVSESVLSPHISALDEHNTLPTKDHGWKKSGKTHGKLPLKSENRFFLPGCGGSPEATLSL